jgi:hypothetical protein
MLFVLPLTWVTAHRRFGDLLSTLFPGSRSALDMVSVSRETSTRGGSLHTFPGHEQNLGVL